MKANKYRKYDDGSCEKIANVQIKVGITSQMIVQEIAYQKFYYAVKKITKTLIVEKIKSELLISGLNHYDYHSDHMSNCETEDGIVTVKEQYEKATEIAKEIFPDFFNITDHMKGKGVEKILLPA
jgi:hypothetical protein